MTHLTGPWIQIGDPVTVIENLLPYCPELLIRNAFPDNLIVQIKHEGGVEAMGANSPQVVFYKFLKSKKRKRQKLN